MRKRSTNTFVTILTKRSLNSSTKTFSYDDNHNHNINTESMSLNIYYLLCFAIFYQHVDLYSYPYTCFICFYRKY